MMPERMEDMSEKELIKLISYYFDQEWYFHCQEIGKHVPQNNSEFWNIVNSFSAIDGSLRTAIHLLKVKLGVPPEEILPRHKKWWNERFPELNKES